MTEEAKSPPAFMTVQLRNPILTGALADLGRAVQKDSDANLEAIREGLPDEAKAQIKSWLILCPMIVKALYADQSHPDFELRKAALTTLGDCFGYRRADEELPR